MTINARFWISEVTKRAVGNIAVTLLPVVRPTPDNVEWSKYTPSGKIEITVTAEGALEFFEERLGKDIAITFSDPE